MITGKYVGTITIDFCFDENMLCLVSLEEIKKDIEGGQLNNLIKDIVGEEVDELGKVCVEQQEAKLYKND